MLIAASVAVECGRPIRKSLDVIISPHLVVGGDKVVIAALDGHITVWPRCVLTPLAHVACANKIIQHDG